MSILFRFTKRRIIFLIIVAMSICLSLRASAWEKPYAKLTIYAFGDYTLEAKKANTCTRIIQLAVIEKEVPVDPKEALEDVYGVHNGASKCIRNGQLIVVKRGRYYNVLGQELKGL